MGILEQIHEKLENIDNELSELKDAAGAGQPHLIDGKAALSTDDAMELLGIGRNKLAELTKSNQIPYMKIGSRYFYPVSSLLNWLRITADDNFKGLNEDTQLKIIS